MDDFHVSTCLIGVGETGAVRAREGVEPREADSQMVPDEDVTPATAVFADRADVDEQWVSSFDVVFVTGAFTEREAVETAVRVGDACESDAISITVFSGSHTDSDVRALRDSFGTVVLADGSGLVREFATDVLTLFSQPMLFRADYGRLTDNLTDGTVASLDRAVGERDHLESLVERTSGSGRTLMGYVEVGDEFTVRDAESLEALLTDSDVVTGQATLQTDSQCRLTLLQAD